MKNLFTVWILFLLVSSCKKDENGMSGKVIYFDINQGAVNINASDFISSIHSYKLELPAPYAWGRPGRVLFVKDHIYVLDCMQYKLFHFTKEGEFVNTIGQQGNGPGEYVTINSCFLDENHVYLNDVHSRKIHAYTFEGDYVESVSVPFEMFFHNAISLSDKRFLCYEPSLGKAWIINKEGENICDLLEQQVLYPYMNSNWDDLYTENENTIGLYYPPAGEYYSLNLDDMKLEKSFSLKVNSKMPTDYPGIKNTVNIDKDFTYSPFTVSARNWIFSLWNIFWENKTAASLYSKKTNNSFILKSFSIDFPGFNHFGLPISSNMSNKLVSVLTDASPIAFFPDKDQEKGINEGTIVIQVMEFK